MKYSLALTGRMKDCRGGIEDVIYREYFRCDFAFDRLNCQRKRIPNLETRERIVLALTSECLCVYVAVVNKCSCASALSMCSHVEPKESFRGPLPFSALLP